MELIDGGEGLCNHVYVDNLVDAYILAAENDDLAGEGYIISDGIGTSWRDFFGRYAQMAGAGPLPSISREQAMLKAADQEAEARDRAPALTRTGVTLMTRKAVFRVDKARSELGYVPRISLDEGMCLTEAWLREEGCLWQHCGVVKSPMRASIADRGKGRARQRT